MPTCQAAAIVNACNNLEQLIVKGSRSFVNNSLLIAIACRPTIRKLTLRPRRHLLHVPGELGVAIPRSWTESLAVLPLESLQLRLKQLGEIVVALIKLFITTLKELVLQLPFLDHPLTIVKAHYPVMSDFPLLNHLVLDGNPNLVANALNYLPTTPSLLAHDHRTRTRRRFELGGRRPSR